MAKLYRFHYSCYARKVQMVLDLLGITCEIVEIPYGDRTELAAIAGGYIQVPVWLSDSGKVIVDSRSICEALLQEAQSVQLLPSPWEGPIWAYSDWCDSLLEDIMFRLASPGIRRGFHRPADQALFTFIKERKFGRGCVEEWERTKAELLARVRQILIPTLQTLKKQPFIFGTSPTLADAALYGQFAMLSAADVTLPTQVGAEFQKWMERLEGEIKRA